MSELKRKRIGEIAEVNPESFDSDKYDQGTAPYISLSCVSSGALVDIEHIEVDDPPSRAKRTVREGDILLGKVRPKQESHYKVTSEEDGYVASSGFVVLRSEDVNAEYLINEILSDEFYSQMEAWATGNSYPSVNTSEVELMEINVPPRDEQERIASVLYTVDSKVEVLNERYDKLTRLKQALMQDLLTGQTRVTPETNVHEDVASGSDINRDEDWRHVSFEDLDATFESGLSYDGDDEVKEPTGNSIPVAGTGAIKNQRIIRDELANIENVSEEKIQELSLSKGDCLMVAASGSAERLGETVTVDSSIDCLFGTFVTRIRVNELNSNYLGYYLNSNMVQSRLDGLARGSTSLNNLNKSDLKLMDIDVPPLWEQERIASVLYTVDEMIAKTDELIDKYEDLKRGLMQDLLSGDVRTPDDLEVLNDIA